MKSLVQAVAALVLGAVLGQGVISAAQDIDAMLATLSPGLAQTQACAQKVLDANGLDVIDAIGAMTAQAGVDTGDQETRLSPEVRAQLEDCATPLVGDPQDPYRDIPEWLREALK